MLQQLNLPNFGRAAAPLKLVRGAGNHLRFSVNFSGLELPPAVRKYAAVTHRGQLLALETESITLAGPANGVLTVDLLELQLDTAGIRALQTQLTLDNAPIAVNLEIAFFDSFAVEDAWLLLQIPVEIHARNFVSCAGVPAPLAPFDLKSQVDGKIAAAIAAADPLDRAGFETAFGNLAMA